MQDGASYIKDSNDFINKVKNIDIPNDVLTATADFAGLYLSILPTKYMLYGNKSYKEIPTENLIKMAEFLLENNYFELDSSVFQQILSTAIGTKFTPPCACILICIYFYFYMHLFLF